MTLRLRYSTKDNEFRDAMTGIANPIADAATGAVKLAGELALSGGRGSIAAGGFSTRWQKAYRVKYFPKAGKSIDAAAFLYHKIPYAEVFEKGATILGKPMMWLPLRDTPKKTGRNRLTPKIVAASGIKLFSLKTAGRIFLATYVSAKSRANMARLGIRPSKDSGTLPLFVGVRTVTLRKRFSVEAAANKARSMLVHFYFTNLQAD